MISRIRCTTATSDEIMAYSSTRVYTESDLSSPLLGSQRPSDRDCIICKDRPCYGHMGYMISPHYLCSPIVCNDINNILSRTCFICHKILRTSSCDVCGRSPKTISIGTNISALEARQELIRCKCHLAESITNVIAVIPRMMRPQDVTCINEYSVTNSYRGFMSACLTKNPSYTRLVKEYKNLISSPSLKHNTRSIMSLLKSKDGLFRSYMVGKRVDHCGRAVIVGTDLQDFNVVSLPARIYDILRLPVTISSTNLKSMIDVCSAQRLYTRKGELVHTSSVIPGRRYMRSLSADDRVLLNRQPSLSRYSLMSFKVIRNSTNAIVINTCITNAYGADFDGDEMGVFMQDNIEYTAESRGKIRVEDNLSCITLIQDCVTVYYSFTRYPQQVSRHMFYDACIICDNYTQYNIGMTTADILSLPFPSSLTYRSGTLTISSGWISSGYVVRHDLTRILKLISLMDDADVVSYIRRTQALVSYLTSTKYALSVGLDDIDIGVNTNVRDTYDCIDNPTYDEVQVIASNISTLCTREVLLYKTNTTLWNMISSGAKGNVDNMVNMTLSLCYQRVKNIITGDLMCKSSYLDGLTETEYVVHQQSSREGIVRTNVHTADVGYSGRRLCKALSTTVYCDDHIVRDLDVVISDNIVDTVSVDIDHNVLSVL